MIDNPPVLWSGVAIAISISMFNYFGLSVTRHVSATARSLTDTCRTLTIWIISLGLGWEKLLFPLSLLQVLGFSLLVYGTVRIFPPAQPPLHSINCTRVVPVQQPRERPRVLAQAYRGFYCFRRSTRIAFGHSR